MNSYDNHSEMMTPEKPDDKSKLGLRILRTALIMLGILIALYVVGFLLMNTLTIDQLNHAQQGLHTFGQWWTVVRVAFIAGLTIYWREINVWLACRNQWTEAYLERVLAGRWLMLGTLCFVELFLVQRVHELLTDRLFQ